MFFKGETKKVFALEKTILRLNSTVKNLHSRVFVLEKRYEIIDNQIVELSDLVNKISRLQLELTTDYNTLITEFYGSSPSGYSSDSSKIIFSFGEDDDDLIN